MNIHIRRSICLLLTTCILGTILSLTILGVHSPNTTPVSDPSPASNKSISSSSVEVGNFIIFGSFNDTPLLWQIIGMEDGKLKLFCGDALFSGPIEAENKQTVKTATMSATVIQGESNWHTSDIREYLNSNETTVNYKGKAPNYSALPGFLTNFSDEELSIICDTTHKALVHYHADGTERDGGTSFAPDSFFTSENFSLEAYNKLSYVNVTEKIFLPDYLDLFMAEKNENIPNIYWRHYYDSYSQSYVSDSGRSFFTRTPVFQTIKSLSTAQYYGLYYYATVYKESLATKNRGIRPMCYIQLSNDHLLSGIGTLESPFKINFDASIDSSADNITPSTNKTISISDRKKTSEYSAEYKDGDLFLPVDVYSKITRYTLNETADFYNFKLGRKIVSVNKSTGAVQVYYPHSSGGQTPILEKDGTVYLSASVMLPWLNVQCSVENNVFYVIPDELSFWEVSEDLSYDKLFNLTREWGDSTSSVIGLSGMMVFDTFLNLRWDRLIPSEKNESTSLYDYRCYVSTYVDMATDDTLKSEKANKIFKTVFSVNGKLDDLDELLHLDKDKLQSDTGRYLTELGFNSESMNTYYQLSDAWNDIRSSLTALSKVNKYMKPFQILKSYETIASADLDYLEYLAYLDTQLDSSTVIGRSVNEANVRLDGKAGILTSYLLELGGTLFDDLSLEKTAEELLADAVGDELFLTNLSVYLGVAKVFYSTVIPAADGFEGMSKAGVVSRVMQHSWDTAHQLSYNKMTEENLMLTCQAYMSALKASKTCFTATQEVMDAFGGKDLMKFRIDPTEELIIKLATTADCRENDSIENKEQYSKDLLEMFSSFEDLLLPMSLLGDSW